MSDPGIVVRPLVTADGAALAALVAEVLPGTWSAGAVVDELARADARVLGAREGEALVGFAMVRLGVGEAELLLIGVRAERRRAGLARALWAAAEAALVGEGVEAVFLEVRAANAAARAFYARVGFAEVGRRRAYYSDPTDDAVVLSRTLL